MKLKSIKKVKTDFEMDHRGRIIGSWLLLLLIFNYNSIQQSKPPIYQTANIAYNQGNYQKALDKFHAALSVDKNLVRYDPLLNFKIGYCFYRTENYQHALKVFKNSKRYIDILDEYYLYFEILSSLAVKDTQNAEIRIDSLRKNFPASPLNTLTDSVLADLYLSKSDNENSLKYLIKMLESGEYEKTEIYLKIIRILKEQKDLSDFRRYALKFIRIYPFHIRSGSVYSDLIKSYEGKIKKIDFNILLKYLQTTDQFLAAAKLVKDQSKFSTNWSQREYFEWLLIKMKYPQGDFAEVLKWCLENRKRYRNLSVLRNVDLYIARCYLRLGNVSESINAYLRFQKRFPKDFLSAEVLWKVAWLYEEGNQLEAANNIYQNLIKGYRFSKFVDEAYFRLGINQYRMGDFKKARVIWQRALHRCKNKYQKYRIKYWIGKSYEREQNYKKQGEIFIELGQRPIDSFYNLKAFYLTSDGQHIHDKINQVFWDLHQKNQSYISNHFNNFHKALLVEELLGSSWGHRELKMSKINYNNWEEIFALAELYERLGDYGTAYRKFRSIFNSEFTSANLPEMIPIFKKLYPQYFSEMIDSVSNRFSINPALIFSVIKKESAFEPRIISYANAYGLMQLLPTTASQVAAKLNYRFTSTEQLFDPLTNINMGAYYLSTLIRRYQGNLIMALAGYNAGPHRVDKWKNNYPTYDDDLFMENLAFEQTRVYVRTCMKYYWIYQAISNPGNLPDEIIQYPVQLALKLK